MSAAKLDASNVKENGVMSLYSQSSSVGHSAIITELRKICAGPLIALSPLPPNDPVIVADVMVPVGIPVNVPTVNGLATTGKLSTVVLAEPLAAPTVCEYWAPAVLAVAAKSATAPTISRACRRLIIWLQLVPRARRCYS